MQTLLRLSRMIDALIDRIGQLTGWMITGMILIGLYNVIVRYLGRYIGRTLSSNLYLELQWYLFSIIFFFGFAYVLRHNQNVRVDFLYTKWPVKRRALINLVGDLLFLIPFCILGIIVALNPVLASWGRLPDGGWGEWELSPDANGLPRAPIKSMIIVGFMLLLLQAISETIKHVAVLTDSAENEIVVAAEDYQPVRTE
jgi:TRAP-type mannitol/chloroaromatic compound transport system permease small subunit